jgi:hypothetical protein
MSVALHSEDEGFGNDEVPQAAVRLPLPPGVRPVGVETYPDAYIPEMWANESIAILEENMVVGNLVHRDFEPIIASYGDTVNTRKPGEFVAKRKTVADSVTVQTPTATRSRSC